MNIVIIVLFLMNSVSWRDAKIRHYKNVTEVDGDNMENDNSDAPSDKEMTNYFQGDI